MNIWQMIAGFFKKEDPKTVEPTEPVFHTLDEAVEAFVANLDEANKKAFAASEDPGEFHFTVGMSLRNTWGLWDEDAPLHKYFRNTLGLGHADDMSGIILKAAWHKVRNEEYDLKGDIHYYREYWFAKGIDPQTQMRIA